MTSHGQKDVAVVIAAHGDRAGAAPNAILMRHAASIARQSNFRLITAGMLKGDPSIETALAAARDCGAARILVYPFFMAQGYFAGKVLPERIAQLGIETRVSILAPLGLDERLAPLMLEEASAACVRAGFDATASRLLVVGHGSELGPASANATRAAAARLASLGGFAAVATAFLEEAPFLDAALNATSQPTIVSGFFSGDGLHAGEDVPGAIAECQASAVYAGAIGQIDAIAELIGSTLAAAAVDQS